MTNNQFVKVKEIIETYNQEIYPQITEIKDKFEADLSFVLKKVCDFYAGIQNFKISGNDEYLFGTSYEDSANLRYYISIELFDKTENKLEKFIRTKKKRKLSTKQQLMQNISGLSAKSTPYIQDFCEKLCEELKFSRNFEGVISTNCVIMLKYKDCNIELIICYELSPKIISYQKGSNVFNINLFDLYNNFYNKEKVTNSNYSLMCKVYKALEKQLIYAGISEIYISQKYGLVDNLLYNVPNNLFLGDYKDIFLKTCAYLINADFKNFKTLDSNTMFNDFNYKIKVAKNLVRKIMYAYNNFDKILDLSTTNENNTDSEQTQKENDDINEQNTNYDYKDFKDKLNRK